MRVYIKINIIKKIILFICITAYSAALNAQGAENKTISQDYIPLFEKGEYDKSLKTINENLNSIYKSKVDDRTFPKDYILNQKEENKKNIAIAFRNRKVNSFFIEDNKTLFSLHIYAARNYFKLNEDDSALNHYLESLRYNPLKPQEDDVIFYEISQVYKRMNSAKAYTDSLETAYTLNPSKYEYSLELGKALSRTTERKKAIYHLKRYIESQKEDIEDISLFLTLGNLNEDTGNYLETVKYYKKYLEKRDKDGIINFALGYLAFRRTGDHNLALQCFDKAVRYLPENDYFRRSKAAECQADIFLQDLEYEKAVQYYNDTKKYHEKIRADLETNKQRIQTLDSDIARIKASLGTIQLTDRYTEYEKLREEKGRIELSNREILYEFSKLNAGKIRWNLAYTYERIDKLDQAIQCYNEAILFDYNSNESRDRILKLKLKIKRGY